MSILVIAIVSLILVVVILIVSLLLFRITGKKKKANTAASSDWQRQGQQLPPPGWNQQGIIQGANPWGHPAQQHSSSPDAWAQPQQGASPWGQQGNQPATPIAYGNGGGSGQSWSQPAQVADQWGQPAQQAQQGFGASPFESPDDDRTMLRSTGGSLGSEQVPLRNLTHEHLQFTVFHPRVLPTATWRTLLVYAYIESVVQAIRADIAKFEDELGPVPGEEFVWAPHPISRDTQITIIPTCPGITFNPPSFSFKWIEDWYRATFRFQADAKLAGSVCNGEIVIRADPLIIATLKLSLRLVEQSPIPTTAKISNIAEESTDLSKQIFASYSHSDTSIVLACRNAYTELGLDYLIDIDKLR
jgi:hypothetical protein